MITFAGRPNTGTRVSNSTSSIARGRLAIRSQHSQPFAAITRLPGIGDKVARLYNDLPCPLSRVVDRRDI
jgi:endonuclease III